MMNGTRFLKAIVLAAACCALMVTSCATSTTREHAQRLEPGDLLFQDLDGSPLCDAIETVTQGVDGAKFSHVGLVSRTDSTGVYVIEAVSAGVVESPLDQFLAKSNDSMGRPKVLVGRLKPAYRSLSKAAIEEARRHLGKPYDKIYVMEPSTYYCSELLYDAFRTANQGKPVFDLAPMTFNDPKTGRPFPAWVDYYRELGTPIPEGEPGLNPGSMSRSGMIDIVDAFGQPQGWRKRAE
jgi:uncharacterized protein YycO